MNRENGEPNIFAGMYRNTLVTRARWRQMELLGALSVDQQRRWMHPKSLGYHHLQVFHPQRVLVRDFRPVVQHAVHFLAQPPLNVLVQGQLVDHVTHQGGSGVEAGQEEDERLRHDVIDGHRLMDGFLLGIGRLHQEVYHVRSNDAASLPRGHRLGDHSPEELGRGAGQERETCHPRQTGVQTEQHELYETKRARERGYIDTSPVKLVVRMFDRVDGYAEGNRGDHVVRVSGEQVLPLDLGGGRFQTIVQTGDKIVGTLGHKIEHESHLVGSERGAQRVPHLPPSVPFQGEHVLPEHGIHLLGDEASMIREIVEILHGYLFDQFWITHDHGRRCEIHHPDVSRIRIIIVNIFAVIGETNETKEHSPSGSK